MEEEVEESEEEKLTLTMVEYKKLTDKDANYVLTNQPHLCTDDSDQETPHPAGTSE